MDRPAQGPIYIISLAIDTVSQFLHRRWNGFHASESLAVAEHFVTAR